MAADSSILYCVGYSDSQYNMGQLYFYYAGDGSASNRLSLGLHSSDDVINILAGTGNVGIGTTSPSYKLSVNGDASATTFHGALDGNAATATTASSCSGNAVTCSRPAGFTSNGTGATWGNTTGTSIAWWDVGSCAIDFRRDNPSSGKLSVKVDGRFYGNEGNNPAMLMSYENSYWGMRNPDGANDWIRTTTQGIIPYQSGGLGSGHCGLGTNTWYFSYAYIDNVYSKSFDAASAATLSAGLPSPRATAHSYLCGNGLFISGPATSNDCGWIRAIQSSESDFVLEIATGDDGGAGESIVCRQYNTSNAVAHAITLMDHSGYSTFIRAYNAVWNDYAEYRQVETEEPGYCVTETSCGKMIKTTKRLQSGCKITSDTFGTCMGETKIARTPIAVAGRVLAYPYRNREEYPLGAAVCSAPNGMVDIMTRDEIMMYPERIVGTVSEIPNYEIWHGGAKEHPEDIKVKGRIWIYVR